MVLIFYGQFHQPRIFTLCAAVGGRVINCTGFAVGYAVFLIFVFVVFLPTKFGHCMVTGAAGVTVPSLDARLEFLAPGQPFGFLVPGQVPHEVRIIFAALGWGVAIPFRWLWSAVL